MKKKEFVKGIMKEIEFIKENFNDEGDVFGGTADDYALENSAFEIFRIMKDTFEEKYEYENARDLASNLQEQIIDSVLNGINVKDISISNIYVNFVENADEFKKEMNWK